MARLAVKKVKGSEYCPARLGVALPKNPPSGEEINSWLCTLPPTPLAGEAE